MDESEIQPPNLIWSCMSPKILNPDIRVGPWNPKTFQSLEFCRVYDFFQIRRAFHPIEPKWRTSLVVPMMAVVLCLTGRENQFHYG